RAIGQRKRDLEKLLARRGRQWRDARKRASWRVGQSLLDTIDVEPARVAALETGEHFTRLVVLPGLIVENAQRRIASGPLRKQINRPPQLFGGMGGIAVESGEHAESPKDLAGCGNPLPPLSQGGFCTGGVSGAKLGQSQRQVIL